MTLVYELWKDTMACPTSQEDKITAISTILQVYCALVGMTDKDFKFLINDIANHYPGPLPDGMVEEVINLYENVNEQ